MTKETAISPVAVSLLLDGEAKPDARAVRVLSRSAREMLGFAITADAPSDADRLELLCMGLTFDLTGLGTKGHVSQPEVDRLLGLAESFDPNDCRSLRLQPASHILCGRFPLPVIRMLAGLAAELARLDDVLAVVWEPSGTCMSPAAFAAAVRPWLAGGAFPVSRLTTLVREPGGALRSRGLACLAGYEVELAGSPDETPLQRAAQMAAVVQRIADLGHGGDLGFLAEFGLSVASAPEAGVNLLRLSGAA